jgi:hypothetical protein
VGPQQDRAVTEAEVRACLARLGDGGYQDGSSVRPGVPYQPLPFPELADVPVQEPETVPATWSLIAEDLGPRPPASALDVGANVGYYLWQCLQLGVARVTGVERDPRNRAVIEAIAGWCGWRHQVALVSGLEDVTGVHDVALVLNVHHWLHRQVGPAGTRAIMARLAQHVRRAYFVTAHRESAAYHRVEELADEAAIVAYLATCGFAGIRRLGVVAYHGAPRILFAMRGAA